MSGAVPCLSKDLTTRAVPHFTQALQMGRRAAPKARGAEVAIAVMMTLCADWTMGEGAKRGKVSEVLFGEARRGLQPGDVRSSLRRAAAGKGAEAICSSARVGVGEGAEACSSTNFGRPGALLGSSVAFGSGCG